MLFCCFIALPVACFGTNVAQLDSTRKQPAAEESIGTAMMGDDGTIVLRLRAKSSAGISGEGILTYPPSHSEYQKILSHLGPIARGQTVPVKPWPD
jgi:hypothetical protein